MAVHLITYYMQPTYNHNYNCDCGETHEHSNCCGSGKEHHKHNESCGCSEDHEHDENCGCGEDQDYDLVFTIETLGKWAQFTPTGFLVVSALNSDEILEKLRPTIGPKDIIFVTKVDPQDIATTIPQCKDWIISVTSNN